MENSTTSKARRRGVKKTTSTGSASSLHLNSLPRFHPAVYSNSSSTTNTPSSSGTSPSSTVTLSPKTAGFRFFDPSLQRQNLSYYQQHLLESSLVAPASQKPAMGIKSSGVSKPESPKLQPTAGSPGPVTPLQLENEADGYLSAGRKSPMSVEAIIRDEAKRRVEVSPRKTS